MRHLASILMCGAIVLIGQQATHAAIQTQFDTSTQSQTAFPVSNSDLANFDSPSFHSWEGIGYTPSSLGGYGPLSALIDGSDGGTVGYSSPNPGAVLDIEDGEWSLIVNFDTSAAPNGYDISSVETFTAHIDNRKFQAYVLSISHVGSDAFEEVGSFEGTFFNWQNGSTRLSITDSEGVIARNVDAVRWDVYLADRDPNLYPLVPLYESGFQDVPGTFYESDYREFDVFGTVSAAVPEPASVAVWSLLCLAGFGIIRRKRRRVEV